MVLSIPLIISWPLVLMSSNQLSVDEEEPLHLGHHLTFTFPQHSKRSHRGAFSSERMHAS